jgi:hypothetical protein
MTRLSLRVLPGRFAVCRLGPGAPVPGFLTGSSFWSVTRTADELSLVLPEQNVPPDWQAEGGWKCLQVQGPLPFALTGILAGLSTALASAGVSLFAISTYDTDYVLVREADLPAARSALCACGHVVNE